MKYPAIYQSAVNGNPILLFSDKQGVVLDKHETVIGTSCGWIESAFKNITAEYLANTYGEVKSKEHAEFIVKLAEVNKVVVCDVYRDSRKFFAVIDSSLLFFNSGAIAMKGGRKQITIPLPPKCESVDEWPKVGDEVVTNSGKGVVKLPPDNSGFYVVSVAGEYLTLKITAIQKPKTPEQELRDEISDLAFNQFNDDSYDLTHNSYYLADQILSKYNITKKPQ